MASERIINEYDSTRIANAVDTLATNLADYSGTTVTPTDAMKAKLPSQTTADRIADAVETLAQNVTSLSDLVRASYEESPAIYAHAIDDILYYNNKFYDVTSAIAIGDTLTVSSGLIEGNISERPGGMSYEVFGIPGGGSGGTVIADDVSYDNTSSGLSATNVQAAIDEVNSNLVKFDSVTITFNQDGYAAAGVLISQRRILSAYVNEEGTLRFVEVGAGGNQWYFRLHNHKGEAISGQSLVTYAFI